MSLRLLKCPRQDKIDTHERTIKRDIKALRENGVIERIGGDFGGEWKICKKK
jgi:predicted DNA-binding transcriptional regulator YafY